MALTVEDGTGLANADSYISLVDAETYVTAYEPEGLATWTAALDPAKEVALRKATQYLDTTYVNRWKGARILATMSLDWPRQNAFAEGAELANDAVPVRLEQATVEAAVRFLSGELTADVAAGTGAVVSERKELGPLKKSTTYSGSAPTQKRVPKLEALLASLTHASNRISLA